MDKKVVTVNLPRDLALAARIEAAKRNQSRSQFVTDALRVYLAAAAADGAQHSTAQHGDAARVEVGQ